MLPHFDFSIAIFISMFLAAACVMFLSGKKSKILAIVMIMFSSFMVYRSMNDFYGHAAVMSNIPKDKVTILSYKADKDKGLIFLWLMAKGDEEPKSYKVPYNDGLHKALQQNRRRHQGKPYQITFRSKKDRTKPFGKDVFIEGMMLHNKFPIKY